MPLLRLPDDVLNATSGYRSGPQTVLAMDEFLVKLGYLSPLSEGSGF